MRGHRRLVVIVTALVLVTGLGATVVLVLLNDDTPSDTAPSQVEAERVHTECSSEASDVLRYDEQADLSDLYDECVRKRVDMTSDELWAVMFPLSELPNCDDIWFEGAEWTIEETGPEYGYECRYGQDPVKRYKAERTFCISNEPGEPTSWLMVGPDDLYIWLGGTDNWTSTVEDGSRYGKASGEPVVETARKVCQS